MKEAFTDKIYRALPFSDSRFHRHSIIYLYIVSVRLITWAHRSTRLDVTYTVRDKMLIISYYQLVCADHGTFRTSTTRVDFPDSKVNYKKKICIHKYIRSADEKPVE